MQTNVTPGLLILHGNQLEQLRAAVFQWLRSHPLAPLETDIFLVQSNGVAEWLKIALAEEMGICAATRIALPARLLWESYRGMLGRERVPRVSPFDKSPLTWRLMRLLPSLLDDAVFAPLRYFLADGDAERRLQLAERLADLFDQYQVYRADWLADWAAGRDQLRTARNDAIPLKEDQRWQAQLWRAVAADVAENERRTGRADIHDAFLAAIDAGEAPAGKLPRRVVLFGVSALPYQTLQALAALARYTQVVLAVPNPCQFYWGDIIEGRDLLRAAYKRQQQRNGADLAQIPLEELHAHSHPLLASWGRQGRDFIRMLDEFDESAAAEGRDDSLRIDLFGEEAGETLLQQVQVAIRELRPLAEHEKLPPAPQDRSIEFHVAHSVQREVEVLHDQLLAMFARSSTTGLRPRDVVVMVPDIDTFTAAIHAVFGQHRRTDARFIPFEIGDVKDRSVNPLLVALEWLLHLPQQRCRQSEVRDLLDVPALAARFGLQADDLATLGAWIEGAGVRWGLDQEHRSGLGLGAAGEQNAWIFGLRRMLLGYASGAGASFHGIEPYAEVGGLDAALAGSLAQLVEALLHWREVLAGARTPAEWGTQARALLAAFFDAGDEGDRLTLAQLEGALQGWLETCEHAGYVEAVPLSVLRVAWLGALDEPTLNHQFVSGGVTFCTLMPMRAVPFRVVCLLGMNDGDFPRRAPKADFDLLALPGMARPGDRSRRDDDRYLMLEALLAARDKLYISWVGRNVRDNAEQPPSVLVSQLRDYLAAGWSLDRHLHTLTTEHALQPFSRRYFEDGGLLTYAGEWRVAHTEAAQQAEQLSLGPYEPDPDRRLKLGELASFLRQPVKYFFRQRLSVNFIDAATLGEDEEPFSLNALERYLLEDTLLDDGGAVEDLLDVRVSLQARADRLAREGVLPIGLIGQQVQAQLVEALVPVRSAWLSLRASYPLAADKRAISLAFGEVRIDDWLDKLRRNDSGTAWLMQISSKVMDKQGQARGDKLMLMWLRQLAAAALGFPVTGYLVARDAIVSMAPLEQQASRDALATLLALWREGMNHPLPTACKTGLALVQQGDPRAIYDGGFELSGEREELCLARLWPEFSALAAEEAWEDCTRELYGPLADWLREHVTLDPITAQDDGAGEEQP
ncbi:MULTISPECIES: exodeoxyribonuclease V subunit gamma [unclassified Janthinobacterium]|uniref:exodeoxyribonuclease V subunit gamma n=1 Tax=unclassified Janthinobacterium TaxID=2610881 RepID=UPI001609BB64|nr:MULTISPECIES: exodeoxyribonuclease V subunit gamma [unclassified Janthinobacterium]MBB5607281.1 exodeoxyribonuclease V gamma subunit [Janthinobacterium sp. S3T4]MBB5615434.1 exodeoxyribonuclease V gamma subunit [Janthinobacterium sp. S3M3]